MNKKLIYILIGIISLSLLGMMIFQYFWIRNAFNVKEDLFNKKVNDALGSVVEQLETQENMYYITRNFEGDSILQIVKAFTKDTTRNLQHRFDSLMAIADLPVTSRDQNPAISKIKERQPAIIPNDKSRSEPSGRLTFFGDTLTISIHQYENPYPVLIQDEFSFHWNDQIAFIDSLMKMQQEFISRNEYYIDIEEDMNRLLQLNRMGDFFHQDRRTRMPRITQPPPPPRPKQIRKPLMDKREDNLLKLENKARKIQEMIRQMAVELETEPAPVHQRINKAGLQDALGKALRNKGIDLPFEFAVYSPSGDSNQMPIRSNGFFPEFSSTEHRVSLFPNDLFKKPDLLLLHFQGQKAHVFKSLLWLMAGSLLFTLIIVVASGTSFVVMIRQKRISDIKTDFINNMTHEFKTPIATISIAADSINNPRVLGEPETIRTFTRIIKEENNRMNTRVEQVLQMALLDSRDFRLRPAMLDMNELIDQVTDHYRLQIGKRGGTIIRQLDARHSHIVADEDHMRNVLLNLLDNANKYSLGVPEITVFSFNKPGKFCFGVDDKGMGMSSEAQRRVFDKFFRVTSGNIHNIKGFGLGLSYVKAIVLAHKGEILVTSEPGRGSRFEIALLLNGKMETVEPEGDHRDERKK